MVNSSAMVMKIIMPNLSFFQMQKPVFPIPNRLHPLYCVCFDCVSQYAPTQANLCTTISMEQTTAAMFGA